MCSDEIITLWGFLRGLFRSGFMYMRSKGLLLTGSEAGIIYSNDERWNYKIMGEICIEDSLGYTENPNWRR